MRHEPLTPTNSKPKRSANAGKSDVWRKRYATKHRLHRISDFPDGIIPPRKIRIYRRTNHYLLQWWCPQAKRTLSERVNGDLVAAITRSREIDEQLLHFRSAGPTCQRIRHRQLVDRFVDDLGRRADGGELDPATVQRYQDALKHYVAFATQPCVEAKYPLSSNANRDFALEFAAFLDNLRISANGHPNATQRRMSATHYVLDVVRSMFAWAADRDRGDLMPGGFRNPFAQRARKSQAAVPDPVCELDIGVPMAIDFIAGCDRFQLSAFAPLLLFGLRPSELGWLFWEYLECGWLRVPCNSDLEYATKGRREKRFPVPTCLRELWSPYSGKALGLLYQNRRVATNEITWPFAGSSLAALIAEFQRRCTTANQPSAMQRRHIRNQLMKEAAQLGYDHLKAEFDKIARRLNWPAKATLKDFRHLFATCLENAGVPEFYRRYFLGQSFGRSALAVYTHLTSDKLREHFQKALDTEMQPMRDAIISRCNELAPRADLRTGETQRTL